tara:strand:+ start:409 stop:759 length:351 start_codon:yes stop_codon:yes gene_type:complete
LEDSKLTPGEDNSNELSPEINEQNKTEDNIEAFTEFLEKESIEDVLKEKANINSKEQKPDPKKSLFKRILNDGFDGITTNPNYKMLGLLIILLINLSLFFVIGNVGKVFLRNAGIM